MSKTLDALVEAERFISGFEDDELQDGIDEKLTMIRDAIKAEYKALGLHFRLFQASRKLCSWTGKFQSGESRYVYTTEKADGVIDPHPDPMKYKYLLTIRGEQWESDNLEYLEKILWACLILSKDPKELEGENLDAFIQGWCSAHHIRIDGDIFAQAFTRIEPWSPEEARSMLSKLSEVHGLCNRIPSQKKPIRWYSRNAIIFAEMGPTNKAMIFDLSDTATGKELAEMIAFTHNKHAGI